MKLIICLAILLALSLLAGCEPAQSNEITTVKWPNKLPISQEKPYITIKAYVTAFNTVYSQTDDSPCISGSGSNICHRTMVAACPRRLPYGTVVSIDGHNYFCLDRLARRYDNRFDISFDKDVHGAIKWGKRYEVIKIYGVNR